MREWYVSFLSAAYHFSCLLHLWSKGMKSTLPSSKQSGGLPCLRVPRISWPFLSTHQQKPVELWHWRRSYSPVRLQSGTKRPGGGTVSRPKASKRSFKHRVKPAAEENVKLCCIHNVKVFCFCESVSSEKQIIDSVASYKATYLCDHKVVFLFALYLATRFHSGRRTSSIRLKDGIGRFRMSCTLNRLGYNVQMEESQERDPFSSSDTTLTWSLK